jgi:hypothetical protein
VTLALLAVRWQLRQPRCQFVVYASAVAAAVRAFPWAELSAIPTLLLDGLALGVAVNGITSCAFVITAPGRRR